MTKDEALKLALEYVELVPDDRYNAEHIDREALVTAIKEALAQPAVTESHKQEPVALQRDVIVVNLVREGINKHRARELAEHFSKHTTPPQRLSRSDIKPLTDEEIQAMWPLRPTDSIIQFARAIEAAHGIKEEA